MDLRILLELWGTCSTPGETTPMPNAAGQSTYLAGHAVFDAPKDGICPLGFQGTLLAHIEHPHITFYRSVLQPLLSHFIFVPGVSPVVESIFWSLLCCVMSLIVGQCSNVPEHAAEPLIL